MNNIAGYTTSGRRLKGPASDIVELTSDNGEMLSAVVFHPEYRQHPAINEALDVVARFLEEPMVHDLVELVARDSTEGAFVYDTGPVWAVADIIRILADLGETAGTRAGMELMLRTGKILHEAASFGVSENVYSHGGLTPWRMMLRQDGRVMVIGHALPQVEILMFHEDHTALPPSDSFRYCPPERIHGEEEDLSSDLFSLSLIIFEFITGKPVYDGLVNDIRQQAARGDAGSVLFRARESLPASVRDILGNAMRLEMADRYATGDAFLEAVEAALHSGDVHGPSLSDVMRKVSSQMQRRGVVPDAASTVMGTPAEIRAMLGEDDDEPAEAPKREKWQPGGPSARASSVRRSGTRRPVRRDPTEDAAESLEHSEPITSSPADSEAGRSSRVSGVRRKPRRSARPVAETPAEPVAERPPVDVAKVLRSSRIRKPRRNRRSNPERQASEAIDSPMETPRIEEALVQPESPAAVTSTADLLAQIRQSATRSRRSSVDRPSVAKQKIDALVRSGDRPSNADAPEGESEASDAPPSGERRARVRTPRRVRRSGRPDSGSTGAEALGVPTSLSDDVAPRDEDRPADENAPSDPKVLPPAHDASAHDESGLDRSASASADAHASDDTSSSVPGPSVAAPMAGNFQRPPAPIPAGARSSGAIALVFRRGPEGKSTRMRLPKKATAAEAVSWLVGNVVPVRTDLTGRLTGWYRLSNRSGPIAPETLLESLDPEAPVVIDTVLNGTRLVEVTVLGEPEHRFLAPMGTAVPMVTLIDHITRWLGLPDRAYRVHGPDGPLSPHHILLDIDNAQSPLPLVLKVADGEGMA